MTRGVDGRKHVSEDEIRGFIKRSLIDRRLLKAIASALGRSEKDEYFVEQFSNCILWESLINTEEHPNANISMLAMARDVRKEELIIAVADNGETIPSTIMEAFQ